MSREISCGGRWATRASRYTAARTMKGLAVHRSRPSVHGDSRSLPATHPANGDFDGGWSAIPTTHLWARSHELIERWSSLSSSNLDLIRSEAALPSYGFDAGESTGNRDRERWNGSHVDLITVMDTVIQYQYVSVGIIIWGRICAEFIKEKVILPFSNF